MRSMEPWKAVAFALIAVAAIAAAGCSGGDAEPAVRVAQEEPAPPILGAQLDRISRIAATTNLKRSQWSKVLLREDDTRLVLHLRVDGFESDSQRDRYCAGASDLIDDGMLPGQRFEIYLVEADAVYPCPRL